MTVICSQPGRLVIVFLQKYGCVLIVFLLCVGFRVTVNYGIVTSPHRFCRRGCRGDVYEPLDPQCQRKYYTLLCCQQCDGTGSPTTLLSIKRTGFRIAAEHCTASSQFTGVEALKPYAV